MTLRHIALVLAPLSLLSACASPEVKLEAGLRNAGLGPRMSQCMADYMVHRLSLVQLRRLQSIASLKDADYGQLSVDTFLHKVRALRDAELITVTSKAALRCAIG